jgi:tRNA dimethylallyltransferase
VAICWVYLLEKFAMMWDPKATEDWFKEPLLDAWYLSGPTASGKTQVAIPLAKHLNAEVISLDSMAVYRGMDIGTAKPTTDILGEVPHHLIDVVEPTEDYSVSQFVIDAHRCAAEVKSRGRQVLFVGGTPLYLKTLLRGMFLGPPADWDFRDAVEKDVREYGLEALRGRLMQVDPVSAHRILPHDERRMTRALEVAKLTGRPLSHWQTQFERGGDKHCSRVFVLGWDRDALHRRVKDRVDRMFEAGLLDEVKGLLDKYQTLGRTAMQAVGYKEPIEYLRGRATLSDTIERVLVHTRQFVRRQEIWFRSIKEIRRIPISEASNLHETAGEILEIAARA